MQNSVAKKIFAVGSAVAMTMAMAAPFAALAAVHAAGTNVVSSDGTVWMVMPDGTRRAYTSAGAFLSYGFNSWSQVVTASAEDLALPAGSFIPPQDGSVICSDRNDSFAVKGTCYEISNGQRFGFTSAAVFTGLGFSFTNAGTADVSWMTANSTLLNNTTAAHLPGTLVNNNGTVQLMGNSGLLGIPDTATFYSWGYSFGKVVPANAMDKAMTQTGVMAMRVAGQLSPSALMPCTSNCAPVVNGSVTASLSASTPVANTLVAGQVGGDLAHFMFSGSGTVTQVKINRIGVSADASVNNIYLYQGNNRITDAGSLSNGVVTFGNSGGLFTVSGSAEISVRVDIASGVSGQTIGAQLASFTVANGSPMPTSISGNLFTIASVSNLATAKLTFASGVTGITSAGASAGTAGTINAGTMNAILWSAAVNTAQRNVLLKYIAFKQIGSIAQDAIQNIHLVVDGNNVGSSASIANYGGNTNVVLFDLTGSPYTLTTGSHTVSLQGDIVKGSSYNYDFTLQTATDVVLYDTSYNVNIPLTYSDGTSISQLAPGVTTINSGTISVQSDPLFTATQFVKNASNITLGQWTIKAYGEDVKVQTLTVALQYTGNATTSVEGFNNLGVYVNGGQVGSSVSSLGATNSNSNGNYYTSASSTFGTTNLFTIGAGQTVTFSVRGDSVLNTATLVTAVRPVLVFPVSSLQGVTSYSLSPATTGQYLGTALTTGSGAPTLVKNANYTNQTLGSNQTGLKIGSYVIQASSVDGVRVNSLTVVMGGNISATTTMANLKLTVSGAASGNGTTNPVNVSGSNTFSVNFTVNVNQTATVDVYADVSNSSGTVNTTLNGTGQGLTSNNAVTIPSSGTVTGQTITIGSGTIAAGNVTLSGTNSISPTFVISAKTGVSAASFNFVATGGSAVITQLDFLIATATNATSIPVTNVYVPMNGTSGSLASGQPIITSAGFGATSTITGLNIPVGTAFAGVDVPVTMDLATVGQAGIATNQEFQVKVSHVKYTSGGTTTDLYPLVASSYFDLVGGAPSVLTVGASSQAQGTLTGAGALNMIGKVTVNVAAGGGNIVLTALPLTFGSGGGAVVASGSAVTLYDEQTGANVSTSLAVGFGVNAGTSTSTIVTLTNKNTIVPGTPRTYDVYVPVSGIFATSPAATISMSLGAAGGLLFNDVNGGLIGISATSSNATYIVNYPTTSQSLHN